MKTDDFKAQVLALLHDVPAGRITSYGRLAAQAGHPGRARMVGAMMRNLPKGTRLPWHRVVAANGKPAFPQGSAAWQRQLALLEAEGLSITVAGKINGDVWWP